MFWEGLGKFEIGAVHLVVVDVTCSSWSTHMVE